MCTPACGRIKLAQHLLDLVSITAALVDNRARWGAVRGHAVKKPEHNILWGQIRIKKFILSYRRHQRFRGVPRLVTRRAGRRIIQRITAGRAPFGGNTLQHQRGCLPAARLFTSGNDHCRIKLFGIFKPTHRGGVKSLPV